MIWNSAPKNGILTFDFYLSDIKFWIVIFLSFKFSGSLNNETNLHIWFLVFFGEDRKSRREAVSWEADFMDALLEDSFLFYIMSASEHWHIQPHVFGTFLDLKFSGLCLRQQIKILKYNLLFSSCSCSCWHVLGTIAALLLKNCSQEEMTCNCRLGLPELGLIHSVSGLAEYILL